MAKDLKWYISEENVQKAIDLKYNVSITIWYGAEGSAAA